MNFYIFTSTYKGKTITNKFPAVTLEDAYEQAGRIIIDLYPNISDDTASLLDSADIDNWDSIIEDVQTEENLKLSDLTELDNE